MSAHYNLQPPSFCFPWSPFCPQSWLELGNLKYKSKGKSCPQTAEQLAEQKDRVFHGWLSPEHNPNAHPGIFHLLGTTESPTLASGTGKSHATQHPGTNLGWLPKRHGPSLGDCETMLWKVSTVLLYWRIMKQGRRIGAVKVPLNLI